MSKPYVEYKGKKYEFEADFPLKRQFDRERQSEIRKSLLKSGVTEKSYNEFNEIKTFIEQNQEKGYDALSEKQKETLAKMFDLTDKISLVSLYDEYCFKMLNKKYGMSRDEFNSVLEGLANKYGIAFVDTFVEKVCEKVFTQAVESEKAETLPNWDWMN